MTPIQTIKAIDPEAFEAAVNAVLREGDRWAPMGAGGIQTHDHNGWLVAILVDPRARCECQLSEASEGHDLFEAFAR